MIQFPIFIFIAILYGAEKGFADFVPCSSPVNLDVSDLEFEFIIYLFITSPYYLLFERRAGG